MFVAAVVVSFGLLLVAVVAGFLGILKLLSGGGFSKSVGDFSKNMILGRMTLDLDLARLWNLILV